MAQSNEMGAHVQINGAKLVYTISSADETKPLFVTLHGGRGFDKYRILSFDYRGHGRSSRTKPYTFDQLVEDIEGMRQHFTGRFEQFILCGGSFGGYLAQQYAIKYPKQVSHLILRGTAPSHHHEVDAIKVLEQRLHKAPSLSIKQLKGKIFGRFESDDEFRLVMHAAAPLYSENFDADVALSKSLETIYFAESHKKEKYFDYREELKNITAKTLIIVGDKDWICPPRQSEIMASRIPDAKLEIFAGANHGVHLEKNKAVMDLIRAWTGE